MKIYTKTGDRGKTSLFDGTRVEKSHIRVEAYGTIDELNSSIGVIITSLLDDDSNTDKKRLVSELILIQNDLLEIGSGLASNYAMPVVGLEKRIKQFEKQIDVMTAKLPQLKHFILPGGSRSASFLHVSRTITRRSERRVVALLKKEEIDIHILMYLNRLSDLFFTMARYVNHLDGQKENIWIKK